MNNRENKYEIINERGEETEREVVESKPSLAEVKFLRESEEQVDMLVLLPSFLSAYLKTQDLPDSYVELKKRIQEEVLKRFQGIDVEVIPSSGTIDADGFMHIHDNSLGNFNFSVYYSVYNALTRYNPDTVLLDLSETTSYLTYYTSDAAKLAIQDYYITKRKADIPLIEFSTDFANKIITLKKSTIRNVDISDYLTSQEIKLAKGMPTLSKSELFAIGRALQLGFPLALLYLLNGIEELTKPEDFMQKIEESITVSKKEQEKEYLVSSGVRAYNTAPYYFMGYHFIEAYKVKSETGEYTLDDLLKLIDVYNEPARSLIKRELEILKRLAGLKDDGEYILDYLIRLGNSRVLDWLENVPIGESKIDCEISEYEMISHAGMGRYFTIVNRDKDGKIKISYAQECLKDITNWIKSLGKEGE